jgi:hypothetical protein
MSNHVHLVAVPQTPQALSQALKQAHGRYAAYWNAQQSSTGHVWQGRFYSCPLDVSHLWKALRYVELNPVRRGNGGESGTVEMVERGGALRSDQPRPAAGNGALAEALDGGGVAGVPRGRGIGG